MSSISIKNIRLIIQYDGTRFAGWQIQPGMRTVQGVLENALSSFLEGDKIRVMVAGRTDSGVHARAQVVSFCTGRKRTNKGWVSGLNRLLPDDLAVLEAEEVPPDFDPRTWAWGKRYVYRIWNGTSRLPLESAYSWHIPVKLDVDAMREAALFLIGEKDFACFRSAGCGAETTIRVIEDIIITGNSGNRISIDIRATAFLRHMARIITGTLVETGLGRMSPLEIKKLPDQGDRKSAGRTAPAHGLTLEEVYYRSSPPLRRRMSTEKDEGKTGGD